MLDNDYYYRRLNSRARSVYLFLLKESMVKERLEDEIIFSPPPPSSEHPTINDGLSALTALSRDRPELFFLPNTLSKRGSSLIFKLSYTSSQIRRLDKLLERRLRLLTEGTSGLGEWERTLVIYSRIASGYKYRKTETGEYESLDYSVVGLLLRDEGVCSAYVNMFILALRRVGIACHRISGGGHAWTMVRINGIPVQCDVTWESHKGDNTISYSYFCLTAEEMAKDHTMPEEELSISRFKGYGYHRRNNCFFSSSKEAVKYIRRSLLKGAKIIRLKTDCEEGIVKTVEKGFRTLYPGTYFYSCNDKHNTAIIYRV